MVMMQSPNCDAGQPGSPVSSNPSSPQHAMHHSMPMKYDNLIGRFQDTNEETKQLKHSQSLVQSQQTNKHHNNNSLSGLEQIIYPKSDHEPSAKFSIERLKQLADHSITRLSPSEVENSQSTKYSIDHSLKYCNLSTTSSSTSSSELETLQSNGASGRTPLAPPQAQQHHHQVQQHHQQLQFGLKYSNQSVQLNPNSIDLERIKLFSNKSKELTDFGFRIQLGGLSASNYARSDTSEELNVDGNEDSSQDGKSVSIQLIFK